MGWVFEYGIVVVIIGGGAYFIETFTQFKILTFLKNFLNRTPGQPKIPGEKTYPKGQGPPTPKSREYLEARLTAIEKEYENFKKYVKRLETENDDLKRKNANSFSPEQVKAMFPGADVSKP